MRHLRHDAPDFADALRAFNRRATPAAHVSETVAAIIAQVRAGGDAALWTLNARFGGPAHTPGTPGASRPTKPCPVHAERIPSSHELRSPDHR